MDNVGVSGFHHVSLTVSDLDTSAAWYELVFDLTMLFDEAGDTRRANVYRLTGTDVMLGLVEHASTDEPRFRPDPVGLDHVAFSVASREAADRWADRLTELEVEHSGVIAIPVGAILNFKDPDGIQLSIFWEGPTG